MTKVDDKKRLNDIVEGASKLPIENQEYILTMIKGMLFTRNLLEKQRNPTSAAALLARQELAESWARNESNTLPAADRKSAVK